MRYRFIREHREIWPIILMCKVPYYSWLKKKTSKRSKRQTRLLEQINYYY